MMTKPVAAFAQYAIAVFHNLGDILLCTPIARQLKASDPDCFITWYCAERYALVLDNNPYIDEVIALQAEDPLLLDARIPQLAAERVWTRFFSPAPYMNIYASLPRIVEAGITLLDLVRDAAGLQWIVPFMPVMRLTAAEVQTARDYRNTLPVDAPMILVETEYDADQSIWDANFAVMLIDALRGINPVFVFTAKNRPAYLDQLLERYDRIYWCDLPFRLNAELFNLGSGFVGVSSGISTLTYSTWCRDNIPRIEVSRGAHWSGFQHQNSRLLAVCHTPEHYSDALKWLGGCIERVPPGPRIDATEEVIEHLAEPLKVEPDISVLGEAQTRKLSRDQALPIALQYHQSGQLEQAERIYRELLEVSALDFVALHLLGVARFQQGDLALAEQLLLKALTVNNLTPEAHYNLANVYVAQGRIIEARACLVHTLTLNPEFSLAQQKLLALD